MQLPPENLCDLMSEWVEIGEGRPHSFRSAMLAVFGEGFTKRCFFVSHIIFRR